MANSAITIIKRSGRREPYSEEKLKRVINWATNDEQITLNIMKDFSSKLQSEHHINELYDELIKTVANKISAIYPFYDEIAKKLYLLKIYKEIANVKTTGAYPHLRQFYIKGLKNNAYIREPYLIYNEKEDKFT